MTNWHGKVFRIETSLFDLRRVVVDSDQQWVGFERASLPFVRQNRRFLGTIMRKTTHPLLISVSRICVFSLLFSAFASGSFAQESVDLKIDFAKGQQHRISCDLTYSGSVVVKGEDQDKIQSFPLDVNAKLKYFQLVNGTNQAIRFYESADADIKIEKGSSNPSLGSSNRLVIAHLKSGESELVNQASMTDVLSQPELELIQSPADPLTVAAVFNKDKVKQGEKWTPSDDSVAKMFRVHKITQSNVQLLLKKIDNGQARVYLMGTLDADVDDVSTHMEVSGIAIIDLKSNQLDALKLGIRETRGPGQITPGFEGKTKLEMTVSNEKTSNLSKASLSKHTKNRKIRQRVKWESSANFTLSYEPRWKMIMGEADAALLRYIDKNELLAQCNLVQLPSRPADKPLTLEEYKKEVAKIVAADESSRLVSAQSVPLTSSKNSAMRVVVAGEEEGLPVNWFYYHVSGKDGRQVTFVFTLAESVSSRVSTIATNLVNEFEFMPIPKKVASTKSAKPTTRSLAPSRKR